MMDAKGKKFGEAPAREFRTDDNFMAGSGMTRTVYIEPTVPSEPPADSEPPPQSRTVRRGVGDTTDFPPGVTLTRSVAPEEPAAGTRARPGRKGSPHAA
jgi:hypothetical protein